MNCLFNLLTSGHLVETAELNPRSKYLRATNPANEERLLQTHVKTTQLSPEHLCKLIKSGCETLQCEVKRDKSNTRRF